MFIYLEEGQTLTDILEGNSDLRSAMMIAPLLGLTMSNLEELLESGVAL